MTHLFTSVLFTILAFYLNPLFAQTLTAQYLETKLPFTNPYPRPFYPGNDLIYLLGGRNAGEYDQILVFSISTETISRVGTLPGKAELGAVHSDITGNIFYLGGGENHRDVYKFDTVTNTSNTVATLKYPVYGSTTFQMGYSVFILSSEGMETPSEIGAFNLGTLIYTTIAHFPYNYRGATSVYMGGNLYIFDDQGWEIGNKAALTLDWDTVTIIPVGEANSLPVFFSFPSSVWNGGKHAYIIGGYEANSEATNGIIQFDGDTYDSIFFPVSNFPVGNATYFAEAPASVFVPGVNRIYYFGGSSYDWENWVHHDEIFYIDLTPLDVTPTTTEIPGSSSTSIPSTSTTTMSPNIFTCVGKQDGMYPHPGDCAKFINCRAEVLTEFRCSEPFLFDPITLTCTVPELVDCQISCVGRSDGVYPHPHSCSLILGCFNEIVQISACPPPLLFDPVMRRCDFAEFVECQVEDEPI